MSRTIGLDLSITSTGVVVLGDGGTVQLCSTVGSKPQARVLDTLRFANQAHHLMSLIRPRPTDLIVIEDYAFAAPGQITRLAEYAGTVKYVLLEEMGVPQERVCTCHNGTVKKFVSGKGNAEKQLILLSLYKRWNVELRDDNIADAFGLAMLGHLANGGVLNPSLYPYHFDRNGHWHLSAIEQQCVDKFRSGCVLWAPNMETPRRAKRAR